MNKILAMDLSMNLPSYVLLEVVGDPGNKKIKILDSTYVDNKKHTKKTHAEKLQEIQNELVTFIHKNKLATEPVHVVREKGFSRFALATQTLFKVVGVSDVIILNMLQQNQVEEVTPTTVKKFITGDGKASKDEVMDAIRLYLIDEQKDFKFYSDDVSDAVAVGTTYALKKGMMI